MHSAYDKPTLLLAQSSCEWQAQMAVLNAAGALEAGPEPDPPGIDWSTQSAAVVAMGTVPYGYSLTVLGARQISGVLLLDVHVDYQSYQNNYEDDNPVAIVLVDGHGMNSVEAMYDLALPTLLAQAEDVPCGGARRPSSLRRTGGALEILPVVPTTWGALKATYR
jgi:hypothetical protein